MTTTTKTTTAYRLKNIDTGKSRYFTTLEGAMAAGDKHLDLPAGATLCWKEYSTGFSSESQVGWEKFNDGKEYSITPIEIEG